MKIFELFEQSVPYTWVNPEKASFNVAGITVEIDFTQVDEDGRIYRVDFSTAKRREPGDENQAVPHAGAKVYSTVAKIIQEWVSRPREEYQIILRLYGKTPKQTDIFLKIAKRLASTIGRYWWAEKRSDFVRLTNVAKIHKPGDIERPGKSMYLTDPVDKFKDELEQKHMWTEYIENNVTWSYVETPAGKCTVSVDLKGKDTVNLHWIVAQQQGAGRATLEIIVKLADKYGVTLTLDAIPLGGGAYKPTTEQLVRFYKSFGFKQVKQPTGEKYPHMVRKPRGS